MLKRGLLFVLCIVAFVLAGCGTAPCGRGHLETFRDEYELLLEEWDDANTVASSTPRINLSPAIAELQRIRRDVANMEVPACDEAEAVQDATTDYMRARIDLYLAFAGDASDQEMGKHQSVVSQELGELSTAMQALNERIGDRTAVTGHDANGAGESAAPGTKPGAYVQCRQHIRDELTDPSSAIFPSLSIVEASSDSGIWVLASHYQTQNADGDWFRGTFECKVAYEGDGEWRLVDLKLEE